MKDGRHSRRHRKAPGFPRQLSVLYEDDAVVVVDKPPGLLAVPVQGSDHISALSLLRAELRENRQHAFIVHRIDRFTSGILLFAKTQSDRQILIEQFLQHSPLREYLAVVRGHLPETKGTLVHHFRREGMFQRTTKPKDPKGARAELAYSVERVLKDATLVRAALKTGLQNQIRVQFATAGHPVIGDRKYVPREALEKRIARVALHACHLEFLHPRTRETISVDSEPPKDFQFLVRALSVQHSRKK
jgi:23S rRNA pseudouridine1911/1915/1917 synthase